MSIDLGIDKKGHRFQIDLEKDRNMCIVGNLPFDLKKLAEKIEEQVEEPTQWVNSGELTDSYINEEGLVIVDGTGGLQNTQLIKELVNSPTKSIVITEKLDEETLPDEILKNVDIVFVGWIRSIPNYATQRLKLEKSTMYLERGEFITSKNNHKERKIQIDIEE